MRVGIRELRDRLKHYVATARSGEDVIITDRGRPVARLVALREERPVDRLIRAGLATRLADQRVTSIGRRSPVRAASAT